MPEVLEIEQAEVEQKQELPKAEKDTWILKLPAETCRREGFAEGTIISLTIKNAGIQTAIIRPSVEVDNFINLILEQDAEYFEEMKRLGD